MATPSQRQPPFRAGRSVERYGPAILGRSVMAPSDNLLRRANALGRHVRATRLAGSLLGLILAAALGLGLLLGLSAAGAPWAVRTGAALLAAGVVLGGLVRTAWLVRASLPPQRAAALVERRFPELQDRFVTAVELALSPPGGDGRAAPTRPASTGEPVGSRSRRSRRSVALICDRPWMCGRCAGWRLWPWSRHSRWA